MRNTLTKAESLKGKDLLSIKEKLHNWEVHPDRIKRTWQFQNFVEAFSFMTKVALLAESHISIHTWPEIDFIALDVFMCGACDAALAIEPLKDMFQPSLTNIREMMRGAE